VRTSGKSCQARGIQDTDAGLDTKQKVFIMNKQKSKARSGAQHSRQGEDLATEKRTGL